VFKFRLNPGNPHVPHNRPGPLGTAAGFRFAPAWHWPCKCNHDGRRNGRRRPKQPLHAISEDFKRVCTARKRGLAISLRHRELMRHNRCQTFGGKHVPLVEVGTRLRSHLMSSGGSGTIALTCIYWPRRLKFNLNSMGISTPVPALRLALAGLLFVNAVACSGAEFCRDDATASQF
jgi:hypothetical protein